MVQSTASPSPDTGGADHDNARASTSAPRTSRAFPPRPTALLTQSWTSASLSPSTTSSRITVGANTSTASDAVASSARSLSASHSSSASTRASTPIPELSFSPSTPQTSSRDVPLLASNAPRQEELDVADWSDPPKIQVPSRVDSNRSSTQDSEHGSDGAFNDAAQDEPEAVGITASSSIHALDLLHRVNDRAAADRASQTQTLRSQLSQLSVGRASTKLRSRSNSRDTPNNARSLPPQFVQPPHAPGSQDQNGQASRSEVVEAAQRTRNDANRLPSEETINGSASSKTEQYADRKYYILSSAGKPIYISDASVARRKRRRLQQLRQRQNKDPESPLPCTSNGNDRDNESDEEDESSTTQVGVMQALISIFADEDSDKLRFVRQGELLITFLLRAPLYLVCVSNWNEEPSTLRQHLEYLYLQVISLVSASQLSRLFSRMPNFDLRRLLEGTEGIFDYMVVQLNANETEEDGQDDAETRAVGKGLEKRATTDWASCHQWWLQALQPIRITVPNLRDQLTAALQPPTTEASSQSTSTGQPHRPKDLLYVLLVANGRIVTLLRPKKHSVHPIDLLLLTNTVMGSRSIKRSGGTEEAEIWLPFSLPKFAPQGFVHAYVKFLDPASWTCASGPRGEGLSEGAITSSELAVIVVTADKEAFPTVSHWISSLIAKRSTDTSNGSDTTSIASTSKTNRGGSKARSASKSLKAIAGEEAAEAWMTSFQRHVLTLCRHLSDPTNVEEGAPHVSAYTCAELGLAGLRHFVYRSNSTIQLTSPTLPEPYSTEASARKRLFTLYSLVHHNIHHPVPASSSGGAEGITTSNPSTPAATSTAPMGMGVAMGVLEGGSSHLASALGFTSTATPASRPLLNADRRLKMQLVKTTHEQVLGWITAPFELYLCVNPQLSKSAIVAIANKLTKWIKSNERDLFLVNAGSF